MPIGPIRNTGVVGTQAGQKESAIDEFGHKKLNPDDFVTLFITQLTHQDPLKPTDSSTMLQQMADISAISSNKDLQKTLTQFQKHSEFVNSTQLIGKKVELEKSKNVGQLIAGEGLTGSVMLPAASDNIKVTIRDQNDKVVKEITLDKTNNGGMVDFVWDGKKDDQTSAEPGLYSISTTATIEGTTKDILTLGAFKVKSVASNPSTGEVVLNTEGIGGLSMKDIIKIL